MRSNGVQQEILSPLLFAVYINDLLVQLAQSGQGCLTGHCCAGTVAHADNICIMSVSVSGQQSLLDMCFALAEVHDLRFNFEKRFY